AYMDLVEWKDWNGSQSMILRYHRENSTSPTSYEIHYTTNGTHISHEKGCGCLNKTVLLVPSQYMENRRIGHLITATILCAQQLILRPCITIWK
ncbi:hypothetical protein PENTCL1PPCAC_18921, partial [Pristionchus entomophagus]